MIIWVCRYVQSGKGPVISDVDYLWLAVDGRIMRSDADGVGLDYDLGNDFVGYDYRNTSFKDIGTETWVLLQMINNFK